MQKRGKKGMKNMCIFSAKKEGKKRWKKGCLLFKKGPKKGQKREANESAFFTEGLGV